MKNGIAKEWSEMFFSGIPGRLPELEAAVKNSAALNDKLAEAAFLAAKDSIKLSAEWTKEALGDLEKVTKAQSEPAELAEALSTYRSDAAGKSTQKMAALADILGRMQAESIRLFVEASKGAVDKAASEPEQPAEAAKPKAKKTPAADAA